MSVIVPVRDRRALLRRLLDALAAQTLTDHEVVVVDDGSRDGSDEEVQADVDAGRPVRLVRLGRAGNGDGGGAVAARQVGVAHARADLLAFTDSDCVPEPQWLEAGVAGLDAGADLVQGPTIPCRPPRPLERVVQVDHEDGLYATCNVFYRRAAYEAADGFDLASSKFLGYRTGTSLTALGFGEDTLLGWRVRRSPGTRTAFVRDAVVAHHVFPYDLAESMRRAWTAGAFPALVRQVPELRQTLLVDGWLLGRRSRLALYGAAAALVAGRPRLAALSAGAWIAGRARTLRRSESSRRRLLAVLPADLAVELVTAVALVSGSIRARTPVL